MPQTATTKGHHRNSFLKEPPFSESLNSLLNAGRADFEQGKTFSPSLEQALRNSWNDKYLCYWLPGFEKLAEGDLFGADKWAFTRNFVNRLAATGASFEVKLAGLCFLADGDIQEARQALIDEARTKAETATQHEFLDSQSPLVPVALKLTEPQQRLYAALIEGLSETLSLEELNAEQAKDIAGNNANYLLNFHQCARRALAEF